MFGSVSGASALCHEIKMSKLRRHGVREPWPRAEPKPTQNSLGFQIPFPSKRNLGSLEIPRPEPGNCQVLLEHLGVHYHHQNIKGEETFFSTEEFQVINVEDMTKLRNQPSIQYIILVRNFSRY